MLSLRRRNFFYRWSRNQNVIQGHINLPFYKKKYLLAAILLLQNLWKNDTGENVSLFPSAFSSGDNKVKHKSTKFHWILS